MAEPTLESIEQSLPSPEGSTTVRLPYLGADEAALDREEPFVLVARNALELCKWLVAEAPGLQWIQVENLIEETEVWATAARKGNDIGLDVIVPEPASQFAAIYRLVDVRNVRPVRVSIPVVPGFLKSLRLAISVQLPVRLLPGQPSPEVVDELKEALEFYLHDPMVEAPVEFFHSVLAYTRGVEGPDLWVATESDSDVFDLPAESKPLLPGEVDRLWADLQTEGTECSRCHWGEICRGFFKHPDANYSCAGIVELLDQIGEAGREMNQALDAYEKSGEN